MLRLQDKRHDRRAKDGEFEMSLGVSRTSGRSGASGWRLGCMPAIAGDCRCCWSGMLVRRRPAHRDHLAAGRRRQRRLPGLLLLPCELSDARANRSPRSWWCLVLRTLPLPERLLVVIDDSPTKRYGPKVEGADVHHNPTPGPADQPFLYGHVWVTISLALRHPQWGPLALPLRAMLYVRQQTMATIPKSRRWHRFATKLQLAARLVEWIVPIAEKSGKNRLGRGRRRLHQAAVFEARVEAPASTIVGRLRKDAALRDLPPKLQEGPTSRSRPAAQVWQEQASAWPSEPDRSVAGKRSSAPSTAKRRPRPTRPSWQPTPRWAA